MMRRHGSTDHIVMLFERRKLSRARPWNPLAKDPAALGHTSYHRTIDSELVRLLPELCPATPELASLHDGVRGIILGEGYPCVGSRSAINTEMYRLGLYGELGSADAAAGLCHDIYEFSREFRDYGNQFVSMLASFRSPQILSEEHFEQLLWKQLRAIHEIDRRFFDWDKSVSSDPNDGSFSLSIGGRAFFVVGLHPLASRRARRFPQPILVFNLHEQFDRLRARGKFELMKTIIRSRDQHYSGSINPMVSDHGTTSEAKQYSGRAVPDTWKCPFHATPKEGEADE